MALPVAKVRVGELVGWGCGAGSFDNRAGDIDSSDFTIKYYFREAWGDGSWATPSRTKVGSEGLGHSGTKLQS